MNLKDRIDKAESEFFDKNIQEPQFLIMRPEAREELKFLIAEEDGKEIMEVLNKQLNSYMGLTIAICFKKEFPDFVIC